MTSEPVTPSSPLDAITWDGTVADTNISVYFAQDGEYAALFESEDWAQHEMDAVKLAFAKIEAVANLSFTYVTTRTEADFVIGVDRDGGIPGVLGFAGPPGELFEGEAAFNGSVWTTDSLEVFGKSFATINHELLHLLGLAHPHDDGGSSEIMDGVTSDFDDFGAYSLNQGVYTAMSYNRGYTFLDAPWWAANPFDPYWLETSAESTSGHEAGPMALDIAVLQAKYGANLDTNAGDTTYLISNPSKNQVGEAIPEDLGEGQVWVSMNGWQSLWDAGGTDTLKVLGGGVAHIDMRAATLTYEQGGGGFVSYGNRAEGGFTIAAGVEIENLKANDGAQTVFGNDLGNVIKTGKGSDEVTGGAGQDVIKLGSSTDRVTTGAGNDKVRLGSGIDLFYFAQGDDKDLILDFNWRLDDLVFSSDLFTAANPMRWLANHAERKGKKVVFDFGGGDKLVIKGNVDLDHLDNFARVEDEYTL